MPADIEKPYEIAEPWKNGGAFSGVAVAVAAGAEDVVGAVGAAPGAAGVTGLLGSAAFVGASATGAVVWAFATKLTPKAITAIAATWFRLTCRGDWTMGRGGMHELSRKIKRPAGLPDRRGVASASCQLV